MKRKELVEVKPYEISSKNDNYKLLRIFNQDFKKQYEIIIEGLRKLPALIDIAKSLKVQEYLVADPNNVQSRKLAEGLLKIMKDKDGNLLASLQNVDSNKIDSNLRLKDLKLTPEVNKAINNFIMQQQMAQIINMINNVQSSINRVISGQQDDRIAICYSAEQQLINARIIRNEKIRQLCYVSAIKSAEDARNMLMLDLKRNLDFVNNLTEKKTEMIFSKTSTNDVHKRIQEIDKGFSILTKATLVESAIFYELAEKNAMLNCLSSHVEFINKNFNRKTILKLNSNAKESSDYWFKQLPKTTKKLGFLIETLGNSYEEKNLLNNNETSLFAQMEEN